MYSCGSDRGIGKVPSSLGLSRCSRYEGGVSLVPGGVQGVSRLVSARHLRVDPPPVCRPDSLTYQVGRYYLLISRAISV